MKLAMIDDRANLFIIIIHFLKLNYIINEYQIYDNQIVEKYFVLN